MTQNMWISGWEIQKGSLNRTPMDVVTSPSWACQVRAILLYVYYVIICHYMFFAYLPRTPSTGTPPSLAFHQASFLPGIGRGKRGRFQRMYSCIPHPIRGTKDEETMNVLRWTKDQKI